MEVNVNTAWAAPNGGSNYVGNKQQSMDVMLNCQLMSNIYVL